MVSARFALASLVALPLALGLPACGGGGGGGGGGSSAATAEFLVSSSGEAGLFSLCADVTALRLTRADGGASENLLAAPVSLEFVGMADLADWLTKVDLEPATYTALEVDFDRSSLRALSLAGAVVPLEMPNATWRVELDRPQVVKRGSGERMEVVLDLDESITGALLPAPPQFIPAGDVYSLGDGDDDRPIDEVEGLVVEVSLPERAFGIEVFHDEGLDHPMGVLTVLVEEGTTLVDDNGQEFPNAEAFFASLRVGLTVVEVYGDLNELGRLVARRVEIEDQAGERPPVVEIEGMVLYVFDDDELGVDDGEGLFVLLIREIEAGRDIADPILEGIGDPSAIDVIWNEATVFVGPGGEEIDPDQLSAGQCVDVAFDTFRGAPFLASEIEIELRDRCFRGIIEEVDADSGEVVLWLDDDDDDHPDYDDGFDDDDERSVTVDLSEAEICLDVRGRPALEVSDLVSGMKLSVCGTIERRPGDIEGDPDRPVILGRRAKLKPGHLIKGIPAETDPVACSFVLGSSQIVQTFGDEVTSGRLNVLIDDQASFRNDADSKAEFFLLFDFLEGEEYLDLKIKGIGSGEPNEIVAYELKVKVRGDHGNGGEGDDDDDDDGSGDDDDGFGDDDDDFGDDDDGEHEDDDDDDDDEEEV